MTGRPRPLPDHLAQTFSVDAALRAGVSRDRLTARDLDAPFPGVRTRRAPRPTTDPRRDDESPTATEARRLALEIIDLARAYMLIAPRNALFSHVTAAVIWQLPLPLRVLRNRRLDVSVLGDRRAPRARGVAGHQLRPDMTHVVDHDGLAVTSPATTWALLAPLLTPDELVEVGDAIVYIPRARGMRRGSPADALATLDELATAMWAGRRRGVEKLRAVLPAIRVGAASPGETKIRLACIRARLPEPELDVDVFRTDGTPIGFTELAFRKYRVLGEYEGDQHRVDRARWYRDIDKHQDCRDAGWDVVRITARHTHNHCREAVARIRAALMRNGWRPSVHPTPFGGIPTPKPSPASDDVGLGGLGDGNAP